MISNLPFKKIFSGNVFVLMSGTFISQLIPFIISPILTRIFSPEEFGMFGLYFSISMIISVFITGRFESTIILPKSDADAINLAGLSLSITLLISILLFLLILFFKHPVSVLLKNPGIENWLFILPVTMFSIGLFQTLNYWNNRKEKYKQMAVSRVARSAGTSVASIAIGYALLKKGGLILGDTIGQLLASFLLFFTTWKNDKHLVKEISKSKMKEQAIRYQQFPKFNVASGLFQKISSHAPVLMLSSFFGETITGFFSFSQRIISAPSAIIARAIGDVFRQKANVEFLEKGNCSALFLKTLKLLAAIGIVPFTLFYFFAPEIFGFIFGKEWLIAGEYSKIMTVMFFLQFVVSPISSMFLIAEKQHIDLWIQIILLLGVLSSFAGGYNIFGKPEICILLFTFVYSCKYIVELYLSYKFSKGIKQV